MKMTRLWSKGVAGVNIQWPFVSLYRASLAKLLFPDSYNHILVLGFQRVLSSSLLVKYQRFGLVLELLGHQMPEREKTFSGAWGDGPIE
jgi:hypothetical protein